MHAVLEGCNSAFRLQCPWASCFPCGLREYNLNLSQPQIPLEDLLRPCGLGAENLHSNGPRSCWFSGLDDCWSSELLHCASVFSCDHQEGTRPVCFCQEVCPLHCQQVYFVNIPATSL